jgi:hypothetical protein
LVSEVEFNRAFPHDRNEDGNHGSVLEGSKNRWGFPSKNLSRSHARRQACPSPIASERR